MKGILIFALLLVGAVTLAGSSTAAPDGMSMRIDKRAQSMTGTVIFTARVTCGPLPGTLDFTESVISAVQSKSGARGEGSLVGEIVCDGVTHVHTGTVGGGFQPGPANAFVSVTACNILPSGEQVCVQESARRRISISSEADLNLSPGTYVAGTTEPEQWDFNFGGVPRTQTFTVTNSGGSVSDTLLVSGATNPTFALSSDDCTNRVLAPDGQCMFAITYTAPASCTSVPPAGFDVFGQSGPPHYIHLGVAAACP
jgi:hypothetical protein